MSPDEAGPELSTFGPPAWGDHGPLRATLGERVRQLLHEACELFTSEAGAPPGWRPGQDETSELTFLWEVESMYLKTVREALPAYEKPAEGHCVYRAFTKERVLLYVGYTSNLRNRLSEHKRSAAWWPEMHRIKHETFPGRDAALLAELQAIQTEHPLWNIAGRRAR